MTLPSVYHKLSSVRFLKEQFMSWSDCCFILNPLLGILGYKDCFDRRVKVCVYAYMLWERKLMNDPFRFRMPTFKNTCRNCTSTFPERVHTSMPNHLQSKGCDCSGDQER